jgi:hypothetical protein
MAAMMLGWDWARPKVARNWAALKPCRAAISRMNACTSGRLASGWPAYAAVVAGSGAGEGAASGAGGIGASSAGRRSGAGGAQALNSRAKPIKNRLFTRKSRRWRRR